MALLDGDTIVLVYPEVLGVDDYGNETRLPGTVPIRVSALVQSAALKRPSLNGATPELLRILCRSFPAGPWGKVTYDGRDWDVLGATKSHQSFVMTAHDTVTLKARTPEVID